MHQRLRDPDPFALDDDTLEQTPGLMWGPECETHRVNGAIEVVAPMESAAARQLEASPDWSMVRAVWYPEGDERKNTMRYRLTRRR